MRTLLGCVVDAGIPASAILPPCEQKKRDDSEKHYPRDDGDGFRHDENIIETWVAAYLGAYT